MLLLAAQFALFVLLIWQYDASFAWFSLALLYQFVGGLPRRTGRCAARRVRAAGGARRHGPRAARSIRGSW
jgi:hypothetical protein